MKALSAFNKSIPKILKSLSKSYGVTTSIYFPIKLDENFGGKGSNVKYASEASYEEKMLIPSLLREKVSGSAGIIDPFSDDANTLFLPGSAYIPNYSKVVVSMSKGEAVAVFRVDSCSVIKDDEYIYLRKYALMPISDIGQMANELVTMEDMLDKELSLEEDLETPILRDSVDTLPNPIQISQSTTSVAETPKPAETVTQKLKKLVWAYAPLVEDGVS